MKSTSLFKTKYCLSIKHLISLFSLGLILFFSPCADGKIKCPERILSFFKQIKQISWTEKSPYFQSNPSKNLEDLEDFRLEHQKSEYENYLLPRFQKRAQDMGYMEKLPSFQYGRMYLVEPQLKTEFSSRNPKRTKYRFRAFFHIQEIGSGHIVNSKEAETGETLQLRTQSGVQELKLRPNQFILYKSLSELALDSRALSLDQVIEQGLRLESRYVHLRYREFKGKTHTFAKGRVQSFTVKQNDRISIEVDNKVFSIAPHERHEYSIVGFLPEELH